MKIKSFLKKCLSASILPVGVGLPVVAFAFGLIFAINGDDFLNVMPTALHGVLVASVSIINLVLWICIRRGKGTGSRLLRVLCGFAIGVSAVYAIMLLPLEVLGLMACVCAFWYFGIGFLGLVPWAPATALVAGIVLFVKLRRAANGVKGFAMGLLASAIVWAVVLSDAGLAYFGCAQGLSADPQVAARGIGLARLSSRTDIVRNFCAVRGYSFSPWSLLASRGRRTASSEDYDLLYYFITGENPAYIHQWGGGRRRFLSWDAITGGEKVGGVLEGLSLRGSAYDTTVDKVAGIGYGEWTMTFANSTEWREVEARCRIALPPGGVVSRLTLWIGGEECEAAFGTRGQVRQAYESVVSRRRDPVLVNICGPDQVQLQCFPVPAKGEMKVRVGITFPLDVAADGRSACLPAPAIVSSNFSIPSDIIGMPSPTSFAFDTPPASVAVYSCDDNETIKDAAIVQKCSGGALWAPAHAAFVIDTSAAMKPHMGAVLAALAKVPDGVGRSFWFTGDVSPDAPLEKLPASVSCRGGRPALATLVKAIDGLSVRGEPSALVWIHSGELVSRQTGDALALKLAKASSVKLYICQVAEGECALTEPMPPSANIISLTADALHSGVGSALERLFGSWGAEGWLAIRDKVGSTDVPEGAVPAGDHLGRLWAAEETARIFRVGDPVAIEMAQKTALPWHIVTSATGAVVLETKAQYAENGLEQADAESVPTTPEPIGVLCLAVAAIVFVLALYVRRRRIAA